MIRTRTKIEAVLAVAFLLVISISSVFAVTRTISDTGDTVDTYIRNSKGNYWTATGANIRTAIFDLNSTSGGTVWLPSGTLYVSVFTKLINHVAVIGAGKGVTVIKAANGMTTDIIGCWDSGTTTARNNVTLKDFTIEGNSTCSNGVIFMRVTDFLIDNIETRNTKANGFSISEMGTTNHCTRGVISNCVSINADVLASGSYHGLGIAGLSDSRISDIYAYNNPGSFGIDFHAVHNCTISNALVERCGYGIKFFGDVGEWGGDNTVSNINIRDCVQALGSSMWMKREHNSTFSNVNIYGGLYTGLVIDGSSYLTIVGLHIDQASTGEVGLKIDDGIADPTHITISDGYIRNPKAARAAFTMEDSNNVTISNMDFIGALNAQQIANTKYITFVGCRFLQGTYGVALVNTKYTKFSSCDFNYNSLDGVETGIGTANTNYSFINCNFISNAKGMDIEGDSNITIMGCFFQGNSDDGVECNAVDSVIFTNNLCWGDSFDDNIVRAPKIVATADNIGMVII
jgi:hypothetical protein